MPKIIFYDYVVAYFPARVRLLLNEKEFTHKHVNIDIFYGENMSRDFCKINKNMTLPVVTVDDQVMSQSMEICQYLHTLNPFGKDSDPALVKKFVDLIKDWDGNCWSDMQLQGTARSFFTLFEQFKERYCQARLDECTQDDQTSRQAYQTKLLQIKQPFSSQDKQECQEQLDSILITAQESLDKNLFLAGKDYSMADILMTCLLVRLKDAGTIKRNLSNHPQIQDYFKRVQSRPSFQKTFSGSQFAKVFGLMVFRDIPSLFLSKLTGRY